VRWVPAAAICLGLLAISPRALAVDIEIDCERLSDKDAEELSARARLTVRNSKKLPKSLLFACDVDQAEVVWNGPPLELIRVKNESNLLEGFLDALELRSRGAPKPKKSRVPKPTPGETPTWDREAPQPKPTPSSPNGGFGVGIVSEFTGDEKTTPQLGPRLDVALGKNPLSITLGESVRFGRARGEFDTFLLDVGAGLAWGAPFNRGYPVGAVAGLGIEWFSANSATKTSGTAILGLRGAITLAPLALWLGVDGHTRFSPQYIGEDVDILMPRYSVLASIGVVLLVEGGWKLSKPDGPPPPEEEDEDEPEARWR
jgi:hypothetical protein